MIRIFLSVFLFVFVSVQSVLAQANDAGTSWLQIEAHPSLTVATQRAQTYAEALPDVHGFALGNGWYAVTIGPFDRPSAEVRLRQLRAQGDIPRDSFVVPREALRQRIWPAGTEPQPTTIAPAQQPAQLQANTTPQPPVEPEVIDETPREARASEARLNAEERKQLQIYLQWAGYYNSAIDGAFGRGTRGSMAAWQRDNGYEPTGILTTLQRAALRNQYYAVLEGMGMRAVTDTRAGIEMILPMGVVARGKDEYPFAHYDATGDLPAKVLLISQEGDQNTLFGLYDIMQTLEIVPRTGERSRKDRSFTLIGQNAEIISHTEASLENGRVKGFTLVWPTGDETRRTRILDEMRASFKRLPSVLDPGAGSNAEQNIDLVAGLEIRRPRLSRSGFYVDANGTVLTTTDAVQNCGSITLDTDYEATLVSADTDTGIAILSPTGRLAPQGHASFLDGDARLQTEVAVSGYSYEGLLGAPTMTFGTLADVKGLSGEPDIKRLALAPLPGDAGGPVFAADGSVLGMLLPDAASGARQLPGEVSFAIGSAALKSALDAAQISIAPAPLGATMTPEEMTRKARGMTVLVSCWD
ncbi:MAG: peptidoglycan-binding protein [Rhodobacteraceae bacterium]|nr:peptidoglycan-binding protein [Paracoccaceae bacterium]